MKEKIRLCVAKLRTMKKKKRIFIPVGVMIVVLAAVSVFAVRLRGGNIDAAELSVQSQEAETGSISTTVVGTGSLAAGASTDVIVPAGIKIKEVLVEAGDTVTAGQTLATVDEASVASKLIEVKEAIEAVQDDIDNLSDDAQDAETTEYLKSKVLEGELSDLSEAQSALASLLDTKAITAVCDGTIDTVNVEADAEVTQAGASSSATTQSSGTASTGTSVSAQNMSAVQSPAAGSGAVIQLTASVDAANASGQDGTANIASVDEKIKITDCGTLAVTAPVTGQKPQEQISQTDQYTGTISWNCSTPAFQAGTVYTATIKLTAKEGYEFSQNIIPEVAGATVSYEILENDAGESILKIKARFAKTGENEEASSQNQQSQNNGTAGGTGTENSGNAGTTGNGLQGSTGAASGSGTTSGSGTASGSGSASSGSIASGSVSSGTTSASGSDTSSGTSETSQYSAYEAAAFGIASGEDMTVAIEVDELDIGSVEKGQTATITMDALEGQEFEGEITKVASTSTGGSSSAKYEVQITLDRTKDMLLGMSASATIHIDESEDAVLIPVSALQERGGSTFVYTKKDSDGNLSGEVEVETGLSDGSQVEITSGLKEGDTVYYLKAESTDSSDGFSMMSPDGGQMPDGGGMPGGGEMPDMGNAGQGGGPGGGSSQPSRSSQ